MVDKALTVVEISLSILFTPLAKFATRVSTLCKGAIMFAVAFSVSSTGKFYKKLTYYLKKIQKLWLLVPIMLRYDPL